MNSREKRPADVQPDSAEAQRRRLEEAEREAAKGGAENYQDRERDDKVVSTGQDDAEDVGSIDQIDNDEARKTGKSK